MKSIMIDGNERFINEVFYDAKSNRTLIVQLLQNEASCEPKWYGGRKHPQLVVEFRKLPIVICEPIQKFEEGMLIRFEGKLYRIADKYFPAMHTKYCTSARCSKILNSVLPPRSNDDMNMNEVQLELVEEPHIIRKCASRVIDGIKRNNNEVFFDAESGLWASLQEQKYLVTSSLLVGRKSPTKLVVSSIEMQLVLVERSPEESRPKFREYKETVSQIGASTPEPKRIVKEKRHLTISRHTAKWEFVIVSQSHHGENFSFSGNSFIASNGIVLISDTEPKLLADGMVLFVHGRNVSGNNNFIKVTDKQYAKIKEAVDEYNATNGGSPKLEWPQIGDVFYYVNINGTVDEGLYLADDMCMRFKNNNNMFQERESAEKAAAALPAFYKSFQTDN